MKKTLTLASLLTCFLGLGACSSTGGQPAQVVTVTKTVTAQGGAAPESDEPSDSLDDSSDPSAGDDDSVTFGQAFVYDDGLKIVIGKPKRFTPTEYASGGEKQKFHVRFKVTIENGTSKRFDCNAFSADIQSGGAQGERVFDDGLDDATATLLPGRSLTFRAGFGIDDPKDLVLTIGWLDEHAQVIFTN